MAVVITLYEDIFAGLAQRVAEQLRPGPVEIRINSYGGSVGEAIALTQRLLDHPGAVTLWVDGVAASAATLLLAAGRAVAAPGSLVMVHGPHTQTVGNAGELRETADLLDTHAEAMLRLYARKVPAARMRPLLADGKDHWLTAEEALALGLVDEIEASARAHLDVAALARLHAPRRLYDMGDLNTPPAAAGTPAAAQAGATATAQAGTPGTASPVTDPLHNPAFAAFVAAERERRTAIRAMFDRFVARGHDGVTELRDALLDDPNVTEAQARARLLAKLGEGAEPVNGPGAIMPGVLAHDGANLHHAEFMAAAADAILARHGVRVPKPHPGARDLLGMDIVGMASTLLGHRGGTADRFSRGDLVRAALTRSDLPVLLENVAYKAAMVGFTESEAASHRRWTREGTLRDFKDASRVALSEAPGLLLVLEKGEYREGSLTDAKQTIRADTYGRLVSLSRQALVNDDLGELARLPQAMGQAGARLEADLVYSLLTDNPVMRDGVVLFHLTHGNTVSSGAPIALATLADLRRMIRVQRGLAGESTLNLVPRFLIVPAALETTAEQLLASIQPAKSGDAVPEWLRQLELVVDARLDETSETGYYLAAAPNAADTIEVARLEGQQPAVEQENGFDVDEVRFKVRLDVGAAALDWRGLAYNPGV